MTMEISFNLKSLPGPISPIISCRRNQKSNTATRNPWIIAFARKRNLCSQSVTFHQRPKVVPTHRQIKTYFFDDDTALFAVLLQGRRHAAALYDWCDLK